MPNIQNAKKIADKAPHKIALFPFNRLSPVNERTSKPVTDRTHPQKPISQSKAQFSFITGISWSEHFSQ